MTQPQVQLHTAVVVDFSHDLVVVVAYLPRVSSDFQISSNLMTPTSIPVHIRSVSTHKQLLVFHVSNCSKIADLKYLISIEDCDHPSPESQKLIISGRIPTDHELIESLLPQDSLDLTNPLTFHLVVAPQSKPIHHQPTFQRISLHERYLQPQGLVFDPASVESAKKWLETTAFEEAGSSYINTRSTVVVAEMMQAYHLTEEAQIQQQRSPQVNVPVPQPAPNQQAPFVFQIGPVLRSIVTLYILQNIFNYPLAWVIPITILYYMFNSGLLERLMKMLFPSLFQPNPPLVPGQPLPPHSQLQTHTPMAHVPTSPGAVLDLYSFLSAFIFSLYPGWEAA